MAQGGIERDGLGKGARLGGYRLEGLVGEDRMGTHWLATHVVLPRQVMIKVLHGHLAARRAAAVQLLRESCVLELLQHAGIPRVYECGVLDDRRPWFAMERIEGTALGDNLAAHGRLDSRTVATMVRDLAEILDHAHGIGVIHGDVRPEHVIQTTGAAVFPVALRGWGRNASDTRTLGDDDVYVAPEIARGKGFDGRADVFALGAVAYLAITGRPIAPRVAPGVISDHVPVAPRCPTVVPELAALVDAMMAPLPAQRPTAGQVFAEADWLAGILDGDLELAPFHLDQLDVDLADVVLEEEVVLVDFADGLDTPPAIPEVPGVEVSARRPRGLRWTPPHGMYTPPEGTRTTSRDSDRDTEQTPH
jgi:serine/threonine-protein kinase